MIVSFLDITGIGRLLQSYSEVAFRVQPTLTDVLG